jgi:hypothetical protein
MSDTFKHLLSFAADPPEGGGGTKTTPIGSGQTLADVSTEDPAPTDPPENGGGGTESDSTDPAAS